MPASQFPNTGQTGNVSKRKTVWRRVGRLPALLVICAAAGSQAQTLTTLASFAGSGGGPAGPLVQGTDGNFYGTTLGGNYGYVFRLTPSGSLTDLHDFCSQSGCADGYLPKGMVRGSDGNFYGTTGAGGTLGYGTVFRITPGGTLTTLYTFGTTPGDGSNSGLLIQAGNGDFFGATLEGGTYSAGTIFQITPSGVLTTVYNFGSKPGEGREPDSIIQGSDGNFYGVTSEGGTALAGTVFQTTAAGALTTLHSFVSSGVDQGEASGLVQGTDGAFYGTTTQGGAYDMGRIFTITSSGTLTTLYSFGTANGDGSDPLGGLVQATDGNFYGTTSQGGLNDLGTIFRITPGGTLTTLHSFNSSDGANPGTTLLQAADGNLYGTTVSGGANGLGTVFRLQLAAAPGAYTCTNPTPPLIASVNSASAYGGYPYFASGSWLEIKGANLADPNDPRLSAATNPGQWTSGDFSGANAPTLLDGIGVSIDGKPAYVWYLSPEQINVQAPEDSATGNVAITVTNCKATSAPFQFARQSLAPGLLAPSNYSSGGTQYMVATFVSDGAYVLNSSLGASFGLNSRPARPGDQIIAYGIGFGDVTPSILPGVIVGESNTLVNPVTFSFGSTNAAVAYAGLAGGFVGLYEFFITVPAGLGSGDYPIQVTQNGNRVPQTSYLTVQGT
ncbi:MAG: choice-of-anchor tandem repeat GloVer-containing protein [Bryobacteraceae bacterium]